MSKQSAMNVWDKVRVSRIKVADNNYAVKKHMAPKHHENPTTPMDTTNIRRSCLLKQDKISRLQEKRQVTTRQAKEATKRAMVLSKAAQQKRQEAHNKMNDFGSKADLLALKAYYLEKEAERLWNQVDAYMALANLAQEQENEARQELARHVVVIPQCTFSAFDNEG